MDLKKFTSLHHRPRGSVKNNTFPQLLIKILSFVGNLFAPNSVGEHVMPGKNNLTTFSDVADEAPFNVSERVSSAASQAKEKVSDLGRTAADKINENREGAASGLENAASTLREKADNLPGGEKVSRLAHSAADKLTSTADYVRENDVNNMVDDLERMVKKNPGTSLLMAAAIGFLVGRTVSSRD